MPAPEPPRPASQRSPGSKDLIESSNIPDLERVAMQEMLNAMTRAGELSGPPMAEDGKDSPVYQARLREREARLTILGTKIAYRRPDAPSAFAEARLEDERAVDLARQELAHIPDTTYVTFTPKAACVQKVRELEEAFKSKWEVGAVAVATISKLLAAPPAPGSLVDDEGRFLYTPLEQHLAKLRDAEAAFGGVSAVDQDYATLKGRIEAYRAAVLAGMGATKGHAAQPLVPGAGPTPAKVAQPGAKPVAPAEPAAEAPRPEPPRRPPAKEPTLAAIDPDELAFAAWCREVDPLPYDGRMASLKALEAAGAGLDDRKVGYLASSLAIERPGALAPELADRLDERGLRTLEGRVDQPDLAGLAPRARMAIAKQLAARAGAHAEARGLFGGALAAELVRQHPRALGELIEHTQGENKSAVMVGMARHLRDDEIAGLGREAVHAIYKAIGAPATDEARRQSARLVRLANRK